MRSFRRRTSIPISAIPKRATAVPPSGTALPLAENENIALRDPPELVVAKPHCIAVGVNPLPLTIPFPVITRANAFCTTTVDESRSNVKPATLHRPGVAIDGLNVQGDIVTGVFTGIPEKTPVLPASTWGLTQETTLVAVAKEVVSNCAEPAKLSSPVMLTAGCKISVARAC